MYLLALSAILLILSTGDISWTADPPQKRMAVIVADWFPSSHPDVIFSRILKTYTLDGEGEPSRLKIVSVFRDKPTERDLSHRYAEEYGFTVCDSVADALTLGTGKLAVDGVLISTEWADYPLSPTGQVMYPHRRLFAEVVKVFEDSKRVTPVFIDKHIADTWEDSRWIYDVAKMMKIPLMAGSSLPVFWRFPATDVKRNARLKEIVGISFHSLDGYGFHGLEMLQCLVERRKGGETGIKSVRCLVGQAVWDAAGKEYDPELLDTALSRIERPAKGKTLQQAARNPVLFIIDYADGLRANLFTLTGATDEWAAAWRYRNDKKIDSTLFWGQARPKCMHFAFQMQGVEQMVLTGKPAWPVERTLLTSGVLDALLISKKEEGRQVDTPDLRFSYKTKWNWQQPPAPEPRQAR
jgi:hypothetical protein